MEYKEHKINISKIKSRYILDLTSEEIKEFLHSFDTVLCDCDGVIWELHKPIDKAGDGINCLKKYEKRFIYVSNNSVRQEDSYLKCFTAANIKVDLENDLFHPIKNILEYLKIIKFDGLIYCIATELFKTKLRNAGFKVIDGPNKILDESFEDLARHVFDNEPVRAVIIDVDFNLSAPKLIRADLYLKQPDCIFIVGATDLKLPVGKGLKIIGPGPYTKVVSEASGKKPVVLGKPGKDLGEFLIRRYRIKDRKRVLVIGDMLEQDISFGKKCDFQTLLVLSGGCSKEDLAKCENSDNIPDYYAKSLADFVDLFEN